MAQSEEIKILSISCEISEDQKLYQDMMHLPERFYDLLKVPEHLLGTDNKQIGVTDLKLSNKK